MTEEKYAKQETRYEACGVAPDAGKNVRRVQLKGFPKGQLFVRFHPDYRTFQEISMNPEN